ncbi:hypothetical protein NX801_19685 [Streptomyces sp. LP05-1]|uniref:Uncharacterized protein n=1 Tax=Streptomyces pyxinae TaxID=2970734 RepID=A0ABT2CK90_9ACTN|nr:hypothetical protein [Streptomyces sp. LP05-1]MCS0637843.1 hypothetical protein [Streptomyces sp. LP05-1]
MTSVRSKVHEKYADFESLRSQAVALRRSGLSLRQIRDRLGVHNHDLLQRLVKGEPPPDWTRRPNAKDDLRARARELRLQGMTYDRIQAELGCSTSSISLWVRDLPKPARRPPDEQARLAGRKRWEHEREVRGAERRRAKAAAREAVGRLTDRELFLVGVGLYWAEGAKDKSYDRRESVVFVNSDPDMVLTFLAWLDLLGVERERLRLRVMILESADVTGAERYWSALAGIGPEALGKTTLKKHNPKTRRKNVGEGYHGCLVIGVLRAADLYRRIEGSWHGIAAEAQVRLGYGLRQ